MTVRSILVTGAAGGLGGPTARLFAERGWEVFAADLAEVESGHDRIHPVRLDVTSDESVTACLATVAQRSREGLGAVVNFAGVLAVGPLMDLPASTLERALQINLLGTHRVNRASFDLLRRGHGRVVNISSETGWQRAMLMNGPYALTKHAVEAYSDALRQELMFLDLPVIVVQPGPFRTDMVGGIEAAFAAAVPSGSPFEALTRRVARAAAKEQNHAHDPAVLAEAIWDAVTAAKPKTHYSVKPDPRRSVMHYLPRRVADRLVMSGLGGRLKTN